MANIRARSGKAAVLGAALVLNGASCSTPPGDEIAAQPRATFIVPVETTVQLEQCNDIVDFFFSPDSESLETTIGTLECLLTVAPYVDSELIKLAEVGFDQPRFLPYSQFAETIDDATYDACGIPIVSALDARRKVGAVRPDSIPCFAATAQPKFFAPVDGSGVSIESAVLSPYLPVDCSDSSPLELSPAGEWLPVSGQDLQLFGIGPLEAGSVPTTMVVRNDQATELTDQVGSGGEQVPETTLADPVGVD